MNALKVTVLLLVLLPTFAFAQHKTGKPVVPAIFKNAQYVYVEAIDGQEFDPGLNPDDRQAIANVQDALRQWNRYALTMRREDANIVIVVRKGRAVVAKAGVIVGSSSGPGTGPQGNPSPGQPRGQAGPGVGVVAGGEAGTPDDLFEVCQLNSNGTLSTPLWMRKFPDGLDEPQVMLFEQFKDAVEKAYPSQPANQPADQAPKP
ncbi:MAG TPA: hypothetical protein VJX73_04690 [Terracidiphilus sp.]|nr:hypothetical protein [Terracidiphilus sp.]